MNSILCTFIVKTFCKLQTLTSAIFKDEKKFFELELVNRESNYNKVFNTAPKIGVINPMNVKTKVGDTSFPSKFLRDIQDGAIFQTTRIGSLGWKCN